jgi:hypothetical protein
VRFAQLAVLAALSSPPLMDARIQESAEAAQALQGPLDGAWVLRDSAGRSLIVFQLADPASGGAVGGAWRDAHDPSAGPAMVTAIRRTTSTLLMTFSAPAESLTLRALAPGRWRGRLTGASLDQIVTLDRH